MKVKLIIISIILLLVMVFASGCIPVMEKLGLVSPTNEEQLSPEKGGPPDGLVKVLIGFKEKPGPPEQALVKGLGGKIKYTYNLIPAIAASVPEVAIEALKKNPNITNVELENPNITNVELDSKVFALQDTQTLPWGVDRIDAEDVHANNNRGSGVKVAIIDSGVDYEHEDLDANFDTTLLGYDFVNDDDNPMDDYGHGTHVAGTIAAEDNDFGVVGVAPEAELYALKVLNENGEGYVSAVVLAIQWATVNEIQVINMSLGGNKNIFLEWACNLAYYDDGLLLVAAAGNGGSVNGGSVIYPAAYSSVIAVSATDEYDNFASFSSTGKQVELAAPGVDINSTLPGNAYSGETWSGTSMASPHVAGTAALVWATGDFLTNDDVRAQLQSTAEDIGLSTREQGYGLVDAAEAVGVGTPPPGTGAIAGNVTKAEEGSAIAGATVVVESTNLSADTDIEGNYVINDVPEGDHTVTASADGYESVSQYNVTVSVNGTTSNVDFVLNPSATGTIYVESITFSSKVAGPNKFLYTIVKVVDGDGIALGGVRVEMTLSHESAGAWNFAGDTDVDGMVKFTQKKAPSGHYTATVTKLILTDYTWDTSKGINSGSCELEDDGTVVLPDN
jgi:subtilisin family serine protease